MPMQGGLNQRLFLDGYNLSGDVGSLGNVSSPRGVIDVTSIDRSAYERLLGLGDGQMEFNAWWNPSTASAVIGEHIALGRLPTANVLALWVLESSYGGIGAGLTAKQINYDHARSQDGALQATIQLQGNNSPIEWGRMLTTSGLTRIETSSFATSVDIGGSSEFGLAAQFQLNFRNLQSETDLDTLLIIQDSSNNSAFTTYLTFDTTLGTVNSSGLQDVLIAERKTSTNYVQRYLRAAITGTTGTNSDGYDVAVMIRRRLTAGSTGDMA